MNRSRYLPSATRLLPGRLMMLGLLLLVLGASLLTLGRAQSPGPVVVVPIQNEIDLGLSPFLKRALAGAAEQNARAVILEINTPGGRLDAVLQMRQSILDSRLRTIAFVNREAFSAGALIAIAAQEIYLAPGAVMGAATPVTGSGTTADAKTISAVRSTFRSTAELRKRDPLVAEAMVDPSIAIEGLVNRGQLLTLTASQAQQRGYADGVVTDRAALLKAAGLDGVTVREAEISPAERLVRFLTNPLVASLLTSLGFLLILADVYTGGFGLIGSLGLLLFGLFFWGHFLAGLAGWEGVTLAVIGLVLIAVEVFVLPGFGIAGILGATALLGGLFVSLIGGQVITPQDLTRAASTIMATFVLMTLGSLVLLRFLPRAAAVQGMILNSQVGTTEAAPIKQRTSRAWHWLEGERLEAHSATYAEGAPEPPPQRSFEGAVGVALSDLRPGGIANIEGQRVDVVSQGDYIKAGEQVRVIADEGYRRVVQRARTGDSDLT
ncbi:NfeD family protein [Deinococcus peraridilitoris]|uniref:Membrane-bound serine protease (ClpP class) n=1 Tax=Deinococcus peraridilitoris (strain DSM 19664 / LMG 22246 / CIP 109416 / KR-200) TaxID=937777 RepID=L0A3W3_DEIPD|nr:NfeD family protein [Deinococcus peraridilitoris]AFZ68099.1 membrane-bound serine protease (ClpP class) [Deinococcus peraridilitoris DSM 19664]